MPDLKRLWVVVSLACLLAVAPTFAEDGKSNAKEDDAQLFADPAVAQADEIDRLIGQLDAPRFAERQEASRRLSELGIAAIPGLEKAAKGESAEATARAIDLIREMLDSQDAATRDAAKASLESLAKCDRPAAASRAEEALKAKEAEERLKRAPAIGGGMQIVVGNARRVSVRTVNGVKDIDVDEGEEKIKIHDDPNQGISVEVTKKKDGKDVTEKYEAANEDELKKKHPKGHELYEKYAKNNAGGIFQVQIQAAGGGLPFAPPQPPAIIRGARLRHASMMLQSWSRMLNSVLPEQEIQGAPQEAKDQLKQQVEEFRQQLTELEKKLKEQPPAEQPEEKKQEQK